MKMFTNVPMKWMMRLATVLVVIWLAMIASWVVSFWHPHGFSAVLGMRKYGIWCDRGFVQFRRGMRTWLAVDSSHGITEEEVGYAQPWSPIPGMHRLPVRWDARGPRFVLSIWRPVQKASFLAGGYHSASGGKTLQFGEQMQVWAVPDWLLLLVLTMAIAGLHGPRWHRQQIARYRTINGLCLGCGYDLRGTPCHGARKTGH